MDYNDYSPEYYSDLLHDWLDGTLNGEHEEALFIALGKDAALRMEMQDFMRLRTAIRNDTAAFTPAPEDTGAIFAKLGFAVPADIPSIPPASGMVAGAAASAGTSTYLRLSQARFSQAAARLLPSRTAFKQFTLKTASMLASACVASLLTILLLDWRNGNSNSNSWGGNQFGGDRFSENQSHGASNNAASGNGVGNGTGFTQPPFSPNGAYSHAAEQSRFYGIHDSITNKTRIQEQSQRVIVREIVHEVVRYASPFDLFSNPARYSGSNEIATNTITSNSASTHEFEEQLRVLKETIQEIRAEKNSSNSSSNSFSNNSSNNSFSSNPTQSAQNLASETKQMQSLLLNDSMKDSITSAPMPQTEQSSGIQEILHKLRLGVRGMTSFSFPAPILEPTAPAIGFLNNLAVSLHYALTPHHAIGVEAGQEAYFQQYRTTENQDSYMVIQYPTQVWGGLSYRYTLLPEQAFTPFAGATVGVAGYGVVGRTQLGCSYAPDGGVTQFVLGVEASSLFYGHQGANYFSPKVGVTYGVSVRF